MDNALLIAALAAKKAKEAADAAQAAAAREPEHGRNGADGKDGKDGADGRDSALEREDVEAIVSLLADIKAKPSPKPVDLKPVLAALKEIADKPVPEIPPTYVPTRMAITANGALVSDDAPFPVKATDPLPVFSVADEDRTVFGDLVTTSRSNQWEVQFFQDTPENLLRTITKTGSASSSTIEGAGSIKTGTDASAEFLLETYQNISYSSGNELGILFTGIVPTPPTGPDDLAIFRFGDLVDAYEIGYFGRNVVGEVDGLPMRVGVRWVRNGAQAQFVDLTTVPVWLYRDGAQELLDAQKFNLFKIQFGWLGAAPAHIHVAHPDSITSTTGSPWAEIHKFKHPNQIITPQWTTPNKPCQIHIRKVASDATDVEVRLGCIAGYIGTDIASAQRPDGRFVTAKADGSVFTDTTLRTTSQETVSAWHVWEGWGEFQLTVGTNVVSASDGIKIEITDNVYTANPTVRGTLKRTYTSDDVTNGGAVFRIAPLLHGFRIKYMNGGTNQAVFYMNAFLRSQPGSYTSASLISQLNNTTGALVTRSAISASNDAGVYGNILRSVLGGLRTSIYEYEASAPLRKYDSVEGNAVNLTAVAQVASGAPSDTQAIMLQADPDNTKVIYIGTTSAVTSGNAMHSLGAGASVTFPVGSTQTLYAIPASGTQNLRWTFLRRATLP